MRFARNRWLLATTLAVSGIACNAIFGDTSQCSNDSDCASFGANRVCGSSGTCVIGGNAAAPDAGAGDSAGAGADTGTQPGGPLASIGLSPTVANVVVGLTQQFTATPKDANGNPPSPAPTLTWSVSGGGTIGSSGLFTAGTAGGGPFTVTVSSGAINATATLTVTKPTATETMGETNILDGDDSGNADTLLAQQATLATAATIQSLSFYVATAAGNLRLGIYDAKGPNGGPGAKLAETAEFVPVAGWSAVKVVTPVLLAAGTYWLAYAPSSSDLHFRLAGDGTGMLAYYSQPYGPMPATFSTTPTTQNNHWSFYATLTP